MELRSFFLLLLFCFNFLQVFAQQQCSSEGSVSIRSGSSTSSIVGRVEYCLRPSSGDGSLFWAVVCNSTFQLNEAHVACRTVNTTYTAYTTLPGADFSQIGLNHQVEVQCGGYESSLSECNVTEVPSSSACNVFVSAAGVSCNTGGVENSVILVGSSSDTEGYVVIYVANSWFFLVASPDYWTDTHAEVVCRQLGYSGGVVPSNTDGYSQPANLVRYQANLGCSSSARGLGECSNTNFLFPSPALVAVTCTLSDDADGTLKLSRGSTDGDSQGELEIAFNGRYGAVCSSDFGSQEAEVVCRQLGYNSSSYSSSNVFASRPHYLSGLDCSGSESSLLNCTYDSPLGTTCSSGIGVHVTCLVDLRFDDPNDDVLDESGNENEGGLSGVAIAAIAIPSVLIPVLIILLAVYNKQIIAKLQQFKTRLQERWDNLSVCSAHRTAVSPSEPSAAVPTVTLELNRTESSPQVRESSSATTSTTSSSATQLEESQNPQLSAEAPPTYRDADQFEEVIENQEADLEKPPPYIDPNPGAVPSAPPTVGGALFYPPTGPAYPLTYPPADPAYPPPPPNAYAYPLQPPQ